MLKRLFDIVCSSLALICFLPVGLPIAIALKFSGEGYIFYKQNRVGKDGKIFGLFKFATMLKDSPNMKGAYITTKDDPRVLPFGKFLRKTKLNEVPQILNILIGDMSIVGPRPQVKKHLDMYPEPSRTEILKIKPGLTGVASIVFRDEESILDKATVPKEEYYAKVIAPYKGELEMWYINNQSFWLDVRLIFLTAWIVLFPKTSLYEFVLRGLPQAEL